MKVSDELYVLEVPMPFGDPVSIMHLSLVVDSVHGLTLVDTGLPAQAGLIGEMLRAEGFDMSDVRQIVITHQDIDHVGSLSALREQTGETLIAHVDEVAYIDGTLTPIKFPTAERLAANPGMAELMSHYRPTAVDRAVHDGQVLAEVANALVVATPGHTPGHMSLYLPQSKALIAGDSMVSENGVLGGPLARATPNMDSAIQSIRRYLDLDIEVIVCYHGGLVKDDAAGQIRRVLEA